MKAFDGLQRRNRYVRTSSGKRITARQREQLWFAALRDHGPLPAPYLHAFTEHLCANQKSTRIRLGDLFHETETAHGAPYLTRPQAQRAADNALGQNLIYDLDRGGLQAVGGIPEKGTRPAGPFAHQLMTATVTASIELGCRGTSIRYIHGHEILARSGGTLAADIEIEHDGKRGTHRLIPDQLFALEYWRQGERQYRTFLVECDRGTEPVTASGFKRKSYLRNYLQYRQFIGQGLYKAHYGLNAGLMVLNVMNSKSRLRSYLNLITDLAPRGNTYMLFTHLDGFGEFFTVPDIFDDLLHRPWERAGCEAFRIDQA